ncbi:MAG TPA: hypothetical protein VM261_37470, partial [Kofleriaceae bacterium]|nr:hypothetical protein [Kofleriaceae bacterium]
TFVSADGVRCTNRALLEYDHRTLACRGGQPTVEGMGLMCKAHNQYEAERALGLDFMRQKRAAAKRERAARKQSRAADADAVAADANAAAAVAKRPTAPATGQLSMHMPQPSPESSPADATGTSTSFHPDPTSRAARAASTPTRSRCSEDLTMRYRPWRDRAVLAWSAAPA